MPGELVPIGRRPKLVASFAGPGALTRFAAWQEEHAGALAEVPPGAYRVEHAGYGAGRRIRVRVDEAHVPDGLDGPDEAGAADGLDPRPPAA